MAPSDEVLELTERFERNRESYLSGKITTDKQIDKLVYELYGLTEEEVRIVEE